jgi:hypothetical protein
MQRWKHPTAAAKGANWASLGRPAGCPNQGITIMKMLIMVTAACFAMLSVAAAADLPRKEPPPPPAAPIGKYPVGKYPVGKYPQPVVTKG